MALVAIAMLLFLWRVSNGPVELDGYSPFFRDLIVEQGIAENISFERTVLTWRSSENNPTGRSSFEVRFLNVKIDNPASSLALEIPEAGMQFSPTALFRGVLAPTFVEFSGLELNLLLPKETWSGEAFDQDVFVATMREYLDDFNNSSDLIPRLTKQILSPPSTLNTTGYLQQLTLADTAINLTDELSGDVWKIPDATLDIKRIEDGLSLLLEGAIDFENQNDIPLHMSIQFNIEQENAVNQVRFSNFIPKNIAGEVEGLANLATLDIPVSGIINFSINNDFELPVFDFEIEVGDGLINPGKLYYEPIIIDEASVKGQFATASDEILIEEFHLKFDGAVVNAEGSVGSFRDNPEIELTADVQNMPLVNLKTYWPPELLKNARVWIENNVTGGMITGGVIEVSISPEMWAMDQLPDDSFIFNFDVIDGTSHFLKPMPQLTEILGTATLRLNHFLLNVERGKIENVNVENGVLYFNDISKKGLALAHFELPIKGRVEEILKVIDYKPLGYPSLYGVKPDSVLGDADTFLILDFPLIKELKMKDVVFDVQADIGNLYIPKLSDDLALSEGVMTLSVNREGIKSEGNIVLNGVDFTARWLEDFTKSTEFPTTYIISGDVEGGEWNNLFLPFEPYVGGPAHANLKLQGQGAGLKKGIGLFDLKDTRIEFEPLGWTKENNEIASAGYSLLFEDDGTIHVNDVDFNSQNMSSQLEVTYDGERASRLFIKRLQMPDNDFSGLFEWDSENELYQVSVTGDQFNAVPIMDIVLGPPVDGEEADLPDFNLAGSVENVSMYNDVIVQRATVLTGYIGNEVIDFGYNGYLNEGRIMSIIIATGDDEIDAPQRLTLDTGDAGRALRALDFFTGGDQGDLLIEADMVREEKGYSMSGTIKAAKFRVANSKAFSELLKEKEFAKAQDELEENGLSFESFDSEFSQYDEVLTITSGSAKGPTLGVTLDGYIDQKFDEVSIGGTIIPAYGLNSFLSNIPLIGTILAGGKGEGVFAATYNMVGSIEDPEVKINPLMALAPGILRKIFGAIGGGGNEPSAREEAEKIEEQAAAEPPTVVTPPN